MTIIDFLILILVAGICGAVGRAIVGRGPGGMFVSIAVGFIGALLGTWIARRAGLPEPFVFSIGGTAIPIVWTIVGAALFVAVISFLARRPRY